MDWRMNSVHFQVSDLFVKWFENDLYSCNLKGPVISLLFWIWSIFPRSLSLWCSPCAQKVFSLVLSLCAEESAILVLLPQPFPVSIPQPGENKLKREIFLLFLCLLTGATWCSPGAHLVQLVLICLGRRECDRCSYSSSSSNLKAKVFCAYSSSSTKQN